MQDVSNRFLSALEGSFRPQFKADAWYDGELVAEDLQVATGGSIVFDSTRQIESSADLTLVAADDSILPTSDASPLACYGSQLHLRAGINDEYISLGWLRINHFDCDESWRTYQRYETPIGELAYPGLYPGDDVLPGDDVYPSSGGDADRGAPLGPTKWNLAGVAIAVNCTGAGMAAVDDAKFGAPRQPASLLSAQAEIATLFNELGVPLEPFTVPDVAIPKTLTYDQSRTQALFDLAALMNAAPRTSPDGAAELVSTDLGDPVWRVSVLPNEVPLFDWKRSGDRTGVYNGVIVTGTSANGQPIQGQAILRSGPLRWGGPFGQVPMVVQSSTQSTASALQAQAEAQLVALSGGRVVVLPITIPANYALRTRDALVLTLPDREVTAQLQSITFTPGRGSATANVAVARTQMWGNG